MAKRILNTKCTFRCPALQGAVTAVQLKPTFSDGTGKVLTKDTDLSGNGICSILTSSAGGTPTPCTMNMWNNWISGFELQKKFNGVPLLNEDAKMQCSVGSVISVQKPLPPIVQMNVGGAVFSANVGSKQNSPSSAASDKGSSSSNTERIKSEKVPKAIPVDKKNPTVGMPKEQVRETLSEKNCICSYELCEKAADCPYMQASSEILTDGAAAILRRNSSIKERRYTEYSERKMNENKISWNNQAHHLISIKAAYCQHPALVKLGNYFGYNINCQENCCFLPCWESGDGYGQKTLHFKKAQAYEVMKASGMQWHVGQHTYRVDLTSGILEKYPELRSIDCYNDKLNKDIKEILSACSNRFTGVCLEENYKEHKEWFIGEMNNLSKSIEKYLNKFGYAPRNSFPYFVSLEALKYAYEIPRSGRVISIHRTKTQWVLKRYQYTNYLKDSDIQLNLLETKVLADAENHRDTTIKKLILFCENVNCFLVIDKTMTFKLPFGYKAKCQYINYEEMSKVKSHFSAMLAEQTDSGEDEYISPKAMAVQRLKECGLY